jgi:cobalt/nickel transport system permease protein
MHIPDAFIPLPQAAVYWLIALIFIALALKWARNELSEEKIPLIAVLAAGIFAIQAFNLPVGMGTSGHLVGGALAAIVLGSPYAAVFILTIVLISATKNKYLSAAIGAWLACFISSITCALMMAVAGTFPLVPGIIAMGTYHALIGIIEGIITAGAIYLIATSRPDLMESESGVPA